MTVLRYWPVAAMAAAVISYLLMLAVPSLAYRSLVGFPAALTLLAFQVHEWKMGRVMMKSGWVYRQQNPGWFLYGHFANFFVAAVVVALPWIGSHP